MATNGGKKKRELSDEAREKLSKLAKQRHAEGRFGGAEYGRLGGRPRKQRASARVAESAQMDEHARRIIEVFKDAVHDSQPIGIRLKGAEAWLSVERDEAKVSLQEEEVDAKQFSREELVGILAEKLTSGPAAAILRHQLEEKAGIVDAEVVDD